MLLSWLIPYYGFLLFGVFWGLFCFGFLSLCFFRYTWFNGVCDSTRGPWNGWISQAQCNVGFSIHKWCVPPSSHADVAMVEPLQSVWSFSGCSWLSSSHELQWCSPLSCVSFSPFKIFFPFNHLLIVFCFVWLFCKPQMKFVLTLLHSLHTDRIFKLGCVFCVTLIFPLWRLRFLGFGLSC